MNEEDIIDLLFDDYQTELTLKEEQKKEGKEDNAMFSLQSNTQ